LNRKNLYSDVSLYREVFPLEEQEVLFFKALIQEGMVLDLGCGNGQLGYCLGGVGIDLESTMLDGKKNSVIAGDLLSLPLKDALIHNVICRLFGVSYAIGAAGENAVQAIETFHREISRVMAPGARLVIEIPIAWSPSSLCGVEETVDINPGITYRFQYLDLWIRTAYGAVLDSLIEVGGDGGIVHTIHSPLHVFTPDGALEWMKSLGCSDCFFYASYDLESKTKTPPDDCLRGVVVGTSNP
jgi:SAM-dependent methyltransferase